LTFFIDNCISRHLAEALCVFNVDVEHLQENYPENAKDRDWIPPVCRAGRIIISADKSQLKYRGKTAIELELIKRHNGRAFYFQSGFPEWERWRQVATFFRGWQSIMEIAPNMKRGDLYALSESGIATQKHIRKP
jgi:PIN like domain